MLEYLPGAMSNQTFARWIVVVLSFLFVWTLRLHSRLIQTFDHLGSDPQASGIMSLTRSSPIILDVLSIGSSSRMPYLEAQRKIIGSTPNIRHFFNATEVDDFDPTCSSRLAINDVYQIKRFCRNGRASNDRTLVASTSLNPIFRDFSTFFFPSRMIAKKKNPSAWLCAQQRPLSALQKTVMSYRAALSPYEWFPHWLIIIDDDTYIHPETLKSYIRNFETEHGTSPDDQIALGGCKMKLKSMHFAHGGFGLILSRGVLFALSEQRTIDTALFREMFTPWIGDLGFQQGEISVLDAFAKISENNSYTRQGLWTFPGYCMHSDWAFAYILQQSGIATIQQLTQRGFCSMDGHRCLTADGIVSICHSANPAIMQSLSLRSIV